MEMTAKKIISMALGAVTILLCLIAMSLLAAIRADEDSGYHGFDVLAGLGITGTILGMIVGGVCIVCGIIGFVKGFMQLGIGVAAGFTLFLVSCAAGILFQSFEGDGDPNDTAQAASAFCTAAALCLIGIIAVVVSPIPSGKEDD